MKHPSLYISDIMNTLEKSRSARHLLVSSDYLAKASSLNQIACLDKHGGYSTHPSFTIIEGASFSLRLKPNMSASKALYGMLMHYQTVIECGTAVVLVYYLSILYAMEEIYGKEQGRNRFDSIFGSESEVVPEWRRLLLTTCGAVFSQKTFHILSFVLGNVEFSNKNAMFSALSVGNSLIYSSVSRKTRVTLNCLVTAVEPVKVRVFGKGPLDFDESALVEQCIRGNQTSSNRGSLYQSDGTGKIFEEMQSLLSQEGSHNFKLSCLGFKEEYLKLLLEEPYEKLAVLLENYYATQARLGIVDPQSGLRVNCNLSNIESPSNFCQLAYAAFRAKFSSSSNDSSQNVESENDQSSSFTWFKIRLFR